MNASSDPPSKGMKMIAAYRAARLSQRPVLRSNLHQSHVALRAARCQALVGGDPPVAAVQEPPACDAPVGFVAEADESPSVFASLVSCAVSEQAAAVEEVVIEDAEPKTVAAEAPEEVVQAEAVETVAYDPPLAEIGFGPGMLIRLSQLGLHTTGDLAHADAVQLRAVLGDISRLVDVEAWINNARQTMQAA